MILTKKHTFSVLFFLLTLTVSNLFCQSSIRQTSNIEINKIVSNKTKYCSVPIIDYKLNFSEKVDKVYNVENVEQGININGNKKVVINTGVVYLKGKDTKALYSPEKIEAVISKKLQKLTNIKLKKTLKKLDSLNQRINKWDSTLVHFAKILKKLPSNNPKRAKGIVLLKQYKQNIQTAVCLNNDYPDQIIIELDKQGNKKFLFNLEKIKNDPNYFYIGESINGFRVIKKRNKYGYLKDGEDDLNKVVYKYDYAEDYYEYGYAVASDYYHVYVLDNLNNEILRYDNRNNIKIYGINKNRFLIQSDKDHTIIDSKGNQIINSKHSIRPTDFSLNFFHVTDSISMKQLENSKYGIPIIKIRQIEELEKVSDSNLDKMTLIYMYVCDLNGKNISLEFENNKRILKKFNAVKHDFKKVDFETNMDMILLLKVFVIPNTDYHFYHFSKLKSQTSNYVIKNIKTDEIIHEINLDNDKDFKSYSFNFSPIKPLQKKDSLSNLNDLIISCKYSFFFKFDTKKNKIPILKTDFYLTPNKDQFHKGSTEYIYNISQKRYIGDEHNIGFHEILGSIHDNKTILISKKNKDGNILKGAIDYNGLYIIPPFLKTLNYNLDGTFYGIQTIKDDTIYELDKSGKCIKGNCKSYNKQLKTYFENHNK